MKLCKYIFQQSITSKLGIQNASSRQSIVTIISKHTGLFIKIIRPLKLFHGSIEHNICWFPASVSSIDLSKASACSQFRKDLT